MTDLSFWEQKIIKEKRNVIVIGAGIVGLTAATELKRRRPDWQVLVLERDVLGSAASSKNAGFACFGSVSEIVADVEKYGLTNTLSIIERRRKGLARLKQSFGARIVYETNGGWELFATCEEYDRMSPNVDEINHQMQEVVFQRKKIPDHIKLYSQGIFNPLEGQLDTAKLYYYLTLDAAQAGVECYRNCSVSSINEENGLVYGSIGGATFEFNADQIIVASNALSKKIIPSLDVTPVRNQVLITDSIKGLKLKGTYHMDRGYLYFRNVGERILIGGARNLFEEDNIERYGQNTSNINYLKNFVQRYLLPPGQECSIHTSWSGILSGGKKRMPIIKRLSDRTVVGVRLGGMGVAIGMDVGIKVATLILE